MLFFSEHHLFQRQKMSVRLREIFYNASNDGDDGGGPKGTMQI